MRIIYLSIISMCVCLSSCTTVVVTNKPTPKVNASGKVPPGQMKKATGSQSAKPYTPGQQKKKK